MLKRIIIPFLFVFCLLPIGVQAEGTTDHGMVTDHDISHDSNVSLSGIQTTKSITVKKMKVAAGDQGISVKQLEFVGKLLKNVALPTIKNNINFDGLFTDKINVDLSKVHILLFSNSESYQNALIQAGVPHDSIENIVENSGGITDGTHIWIPLYTYKDRSELTNILTHELTHVVFHQANIEEKLPNWLDEGIAMYNGLQAQKNINHIKTGRILKNIKYKLTTSIKNGESVSFNSTNLLNENYTSEAFYLAATYFLVERMGVSKLNEFTRSVIDSNVEEAFKSTFTITLKEYENKILQAVGQSQQDSYSSNDDDDDDDAEFLPGYRVRW
ncbi:peptidase MA family metallohydrolase [Bacillus pinisoli]|uniref:peptidase MA family metallohydrolase n=1 Tax=Bacillus pinisoli TaxID=2901866 RepID=UPI001FF693F6|nr:hypothetical protein [Bacillus pinisoli]